MKIYRTLDIQELTMITRNDPKILSWFPKSFIIDSLKDHFVKERDLLIVNLLWSGFSLDVLKIEI